MLYHYRRVMTQKEPRFGYNKSRNMYDTKVYVLVWRKIRRRVVSSAFSLFPGKTNASATIHV